VWVGEAKHPFFFTMPVKLSIAITEGFSYDLTIRHKSAVAIMTGASGLRKVCVSLEYMLQYGFRYSRNETRFSNPYNFAPLATHRMHDGPSLCAINMC
jgi:hypothetical protein